MPNEAPTVAIIGYGTIGRTLADLILANPTSPRLSAIALRSGRKDAREALPADVALAADPDELAALRPDFVVECAGQEALMAYAPALFARGIDIMAASTGALARPGVLEEWLPEDGKGRGRIMIPAGAIAGLDGLGAHRLAGLEQVTYTSIKPPLAWRDTPAEETIDLEAVSAPVVLFAGSAREAALSYPKNANLAATVALAGLGLEATLVRLIADPDARGNTGIIEATSAIGTLRVELQDQASSNPKTSASTAYSLAHAVHNTTARLVI